MTLFGDFFEFWDDGFPVASTDDDPVPAGAAPVWQQRWKIEPNWVWRPGHACEMWDDYIRRVTGV